MIVLSKSSLDRYPAPLRDRIFRTVIRMKALDERTNQISLTPEQWERIKRMIGDAKDKK